MQYILIILCWLSGLLYAAGNTSTNNDTPPVARAASPDTNRLLGLPPLPVPVDNPQSPAKIILGNKLFHDARFSIDGTVSCSKCHNDQLSFTDALPVSMGNNGKTGARNAPTVVNAAFNKLQFWDGREPDLENQSKQPLLNPVEHGLTSYEPITNIIRSDPDYQKAFAEVFGLSADKVTIDHVAKAIASFERTVLSGDSAFDRYYFKADKSAMTEAQVRGLQLFVGQGRCVSCHVIEQDQALFTDGKFHNIGIGINQIQKDVPLLTGRFMQAKDPKAEFAKASLEDKRNSELGRFAITREINQVGAFKTPTLRNIELTAPYMHDGSLKTLKDVMVHYNNGGATKTGDRVNDYLSGGIRPLNLTDAQLEDLVAFMQALTGSNYLKSAAKGGN